MKNFCDHFQPDKHQHNRNALLQMSEFILCPF